LNTDNLEVTLSYGTKKGKEGDRDPGTPRLVPIMITYDTEGNTPKGIPYLTLYAPQLDNFLNSPIYI